MRQVFRSQRLENVEAAADLLRKQGIEVRITNGRSWRGYRRGNFSYDLRKAHNPDQLPSLWIVRADDQPRARQILREIGLLESTRENNPAALSGDRFAFTPGTGANSPARKRLRIGLVVMIAVVIALIVILPRPKPAKPAPAASPSATAPEPLPVPEAITEPDTFRMPVPKALAVKLIETAAAARGASAACVRIDGRDPVAEVVQQAATRGITVQPASACAPASALQLDIENYLTDGSGAGDVRLRVGTDAARTLAVQRDGSVWSVRDAR